MSLSVVADRVRPLSPFAFSRWGLNRNRLIRWAPLAVLWLCIAWVVRPLLFSVPLGHDNPTHLFKAWHFWTEMLGRGRLRGWSHFWGFGFPADELVPCGGEAWVALFRLGTLGLLPWPRTYALALAGMLAVVALASYACTRRYFGRVAGMAAGILTILDVGGWAQGGWDWAIAWGVWPVSLAMAFVFFAFARLEDLIVRGRKRDILFAGSFIAAALVTHHLPLVVFAVCVPLLMLDAALRRTRRGVWLEIVAACALGIALSAFFTVPMIARSADSLDLGVIGTSLQEVGRRLTLMQTFLSLWPPILVAGFAGAFWALRTRRPGGVFLVTALFAFLCLSSNVLLKEFHLERALPNLVKVESLRMILPAKLIVFCLAGYAIAFVFQASRSSAAPLREWRGRVAWAICIAASLPVLWPAMVATHANYMTRRMETEVEKRHWPSLRRFFEWSSALRASTDDFYRIAYNFEKHDHLSTLAPVFDSTLYYKIGYTPAQTFRRIPETAEPELLEALSVRFVLSEHPLHADYYVLERRFGSLYLYRFTRYRPDPFTVIGAGTAKLVEFEPERIRIAVRGATAESRLKLHVARVDRWEARLDGSVIPISPATVYAHEYPFLMEVPLRDGELTFEYVRRPPDTLGLALSLLALPLFGALAFWGSGPRSLVPVFDGIQRSSRVLAAAAILGAVGIAVIMLMRTRSRERMIPQDSLFTGLPASALRLGDRSCRLVEPLVYDCAGHQVRADLVQGLYGGHVCMTGPQHAPLRIETTTKLGSFLTASYEPVGGPGAVTVMVNGERVGWAATRDVQLGPESILFDTRRFRDSKAHLEVVLEGSALHCFDVQWVR